MAKPPEEHCSGWKAWHDLQPPGPATLHVTGMCQFPTSGYSVELRPAKPQGINKDIYLMDKIVHKPEGPSADVITNVKVHYSEKTNTKYTEIHIRPDGVKVPVEEVH